MGKDKTNLLAGTLDLIVLKLLQSGPANSWDITQRIHALSKDVLQLSGVLDLPPAPFTGHGRPRAHTAAALVNDGGVTRLMNLWLVWLTERFRALQQG